MVYDDVAKLTELMGGQDDTSNRLDAFFNSTGSSRICDFFALLARA